MVRSTEPDRPTRAAWLGWRYRGEWYFSRDDAAFDYWIDMIQGIAHRQMELDRARQRGEDPIPGVILPQFRDVLDSLK